MLGWALLAGGLAVLATAVRIAPRGTRALAQGAAMLAIALGGLLLLHRPGSPLPGHGMRRWHQP